MVKPNFYLELDCLPPAAVARIYNLHIPPIIRSYTFRYKHLHKLLDLFFIFFSAGLIINRFRTVLNAKFLSAYACNGNAKYSSATTTSTLRDISEDGDYNNILKIDILQTIGVMKIHSQKVN